MARPVTVEVEAVVAAPPDVTFDVFLGIDVTTILKGWGPLPAVAAVDPAHGRWDAPGRTRTLRLTDGSLLEERLLGIDAPRGFTYELRIRKGPLRPLVRRFQGAWHFEPVGAPQRAPGTRARWRYAFEPRAARYRPLVVLVVRALWPRYMRRALALAAAQAEAGAGAARPGVTPGVSSAPFDAPRGEVG